MPLHCHISEASICASFSTTPRCSLNCYRRRVHSSRSLLIPPEYWSSFLMRSFPFCASIEIPGDCEIYTMGEKRSGSPNWAPGQSNPGVNDTVSTFCSCIAAVESRFLYLGILLWFPLQFILCNRILLTSLSWYLPRHVQFRMLLVIHVCLQHAACTSLHSYQRSN